MRGTSTCYVLALCVFSIHAYASRVSVHSCAQIAREYADMYSSSMLSSWHAWDEICRFAYADMYSPSMLSSWHAWDEICAAG